MKSRDYDRSVAGRPHAVVLLGRERELPFDHRCFFLGCWHGV